MAGESGQKFDHVVSARRSRRKASDYMNDRTARIYAGLVPHPY